MVVVSKALLTATSITASVVSTVLTGVVSSLWFTTTASLDLVSLGLRSRGLRWRGFLSLVYFLTTAAASTLGSASASGVDTVAISTSTSGVDTASALELASTTAVGKTSA